MNSCFMKNLLVLSLFTCIAYCYKCKAEIKVGYGDVKTDTISFDLRWGTEKDKILITQDIDLKGAAYKLPPQKILEFKGGGNQKWYSNRKSNQAQVFWKGF